MAAQKKLYSKIFNETSNLIDTGKYPTGSKLPSERELAEHLKVSHPVT